MTGFDSKRQMAADKVQEPVACIVKGHLYMAHEFMSEIPEGATLLYTTPPKRPWVGLTYEEIEELFQSAAGADEETVIRFARLIESKIKEKNT